MHPPLSLPAEVFSLVERTPGTVLLHSASAAPSHSRLFLDPIRILAPRTPAELDDLFLQIEEAVEQGSFAAGYFAYECGNCFEPSAWMRPLPPGEPLAWFGIYAHCHVFDHAAGRFLHGDPEQLPPASLIHDPGEIDVRMPLDEPQFAGKIDAIHEAIRRGDVYQLNFTFPLRLRAAAGSAALYQRLHRRQPVEFGAFLHCQSGRHVLSFSPELFFRIDGRHIVTRPMKGTAHRGRTTEEDRAISAWLQHDAKNRSENVMIVDLLRNDLGRLCQFGSVHVDDLFSVQRLPTLWQMTSTVSGDLRRDASYRDVLRALFPSGSVTGAPKVRAMQLLAGLENQSRGVYTGAIGYFSHEQAVFNVAIRTLEIAHGQGRMGVGSGIVIDSVAAAEYAECRLKAEFLTRPGETFHLVETMLWDGAAFPLIELHLDRLADSADYFGFACDRAAIHAALAAAAAAFDSASPRKVRLLLSSDGSARIEHEPLLPTPNQPPLRVCFAVQRTDSADRFLYHKTTHRPLYTRALQAARARGFEDLLFLNSEGQVTEGAVSNLFVEKDGRWLTPPAACGLLPGVCRRRLLESLPRAEERVLLPNDLKAADCVCLCNAVRGLREVTIDFAATVSAD